MAKEVRIKFSKEHVGKQSGESEHDVYRERSDSSKTEKIGHIPVEKGWGSRGPVEIPVKKE